jgi:hypothetical protein
MLGQSQEFVELGQTMLIHWHRQSRNLGVLGNPKFLANQATTRYAVFAQHDDYYIDPTFFERSIKAFNANDAIGFIFANSNFEGSERLLMGRGSSGFQLLNGVEFTKRFWNDLMTSWTSVIFDLDEIKNYGGFGEGYSLSDSEGANFSAYTQEEGMGFLYLLCIRKDCILEYRSVATRGLPPTAFSSSPNNPAKYLLNDCLFFLYWNIAKICQHHGSRGRLISRNVRNIAIFKFGLAKSNPYIAAFIGPSYIARMQALLARISYKVKRVLFRLLSPWKKFLNFAGQFIIKLLR